MDTAGVATTSFSPLSILTSIDFNVSGSMNFGPARSISIIGPADAHPMQMPSMESAPSGIRGSEFLFERQQVPALDQALIANDDQKFVGPGGVQHIVGAKRKIPGHFGFDHVKDGKLTKLLEVQDKIAAVSTGNDIIRRKPGVSPTSFPPTAPVPLCLPLSAKPNALRP